MPLNQPLTTIQRELREQMADDLAAALLRLKELLPDVSEKQGDVIALLGRLNDSNKKHIRNLISNEEYQREQDRIRADFYHLVQGLEAADFEEVIAPKMQDGAKSAPKTGSVLYRIPHRMPLQKSTRCVVRVALDEDAIIENITLDEYVQLRSRVEVSSAMEAQLLDPSGQNFFITSPNAARQLVRDSGYTEWLFYVTPLLEGTHQLVVKVSMLENVPDIGLVPREVTLEELVQIVTEAPVQDTEAPLKPAGISFALQSAGQDDASLRGGIIPPVPDTEDSKKSEEPAAAATTAASAFNKTNSLIATVVATGIVILFILWFNPLPSPGEIKNWITGGDIPAQTRSVHIVVHSPADSVAEAFWVSGQKVNLDKVSPGIWSGITPVSNDSAGYHIFYKGNLAKQHWYDPLTEEINDLFVTMPWDTSRCGFFITVDTIIRPVEQWRYIWQRSPFDTVAFKVHPLSATRFFVPLGDWCKAYSVRHPKDPIIISNRWFGRPVEPAGIPSGPMTYVSTTNVRLFFSREITLDGIRVNGYPVKRLRTFDSSKDPAKKVGAEFSIAQTTTDGIAGKANSYRFEVASTDCDCAAKTIAARSDIADTIMCRLKPPPPRPKPSISKPTPTPPIKPASTVKVLLSIPAKWAAHLEDLEITKDGAHYSSTLTMKNGQVVLELKPSEDIHEICLQFSKGEKSGRPFRIGCYNGPIRPNLKLKFE